MKYVFFSREGDQKQIENYLKRFRKYSNKELIEAYNNQARLGIVGVHQQALYLLALRQVLKEHFGKSPISLEEECLLSMKELLPNKKALERE